MITYLTQNIWRHLWTFPLSKSQKKNFAYFQEIDDTTGVLFFSTSWDKIKLSNWLSVLCWIFLKIFNFFKLLFNKSHFHNFFPSKYLYIRRNANLICTFLNDRYKCYHDWTSLNRLSWDWQCLIFLQFYLAFYLKN